MLKFSKSDAIRPLAETKIDEFFARKIDAVLGPMVALHARKRVLAQADMIEDKIDQYAIMNRALQQDAELFAIDKLRREYKTRIRAAVTSDEIKSILEELR